MEHLQCLSFVPSKAKKKKKDRNKIQVCFDLANKLLFPIISGITFVDIHFFLVCFAQVFSI